MKISNFVSPKDQHRRTSHGVKDSQPSRKVKVKNFCQESPAVDHVDAAGESVPVPSNEACASNMQEHSHVTDVSVTNFVEHDDPYNYKCDCSEDCHCKGCIEKNSLIKQQRLKVKSLKSQNVELSNKVSKKDNFNVMTMLFENKFKSKILYWVTK